MSTEGRSFVHRLLSAPYLILALVVTGAAVGVLAFFRLPVNLFPDSERPQAAVITVWPGASAEDVEAEVTRVIETELAGSDLLRQVMSTSRDEVSSVTAEFSYEKDLDTAAADASAALDRVRGRLPPGIQEPMVFKISSATPAVMTIALSPAAVEAGSTGAAGGSGLTLGMIRQIAENEIRDRLLRIPEVARVEVFGGHRPLALVEPDPTALAAFDLTVDQIAAALAGRARNQPFGWIRGTESDELMVRLDARTTVEGLVGVPVASRDGRTLRLGDVATVRRGEDEPSAFYHANGEPAIALAVQRPESGFALQTIEAVEEVLPEIERAYPGIRFQVPDDQGHIIRLSMDNMKKALVGAILPTMLVLFLFLGDRRITLLSGVSLPLTFLLTFAAMWLLGLEFNLVTLTAIIVAVGMLVDNSVVVIENIARHAEKAGDGDDAPAPREVAAAGTAEVALAILGGTMTTIMVLVPILFVGGFVETILRPFAATLIIAIASSYLVAVTVIPLLAPALIRAGGNREPSKWRQRLDRLDRRAGAVGGRVTAAVDRGAGRLSRLALAHRGWTMLGAALLFVAVASQVPVLGRDLMPPMDAGIVKVSFEAAPNTPVHEVETLLGRIEEEILARDEVVRVSSAVGSEPAVTAFGAGNTVRQGLITVNMVNRFERELSIWEVQQELYRELRRLPGVVSLAVFEYGSTPFSTIKASVDVELSGPDPARLEEIAREVEERLRSEVRGLTSVGLSWRRDTVQRVFDIDADRAARHGTTPEAVAAQLAGLLRGRPATELRMPAQRGLPVTVQVPERERDAVARIAGLEVVTPTGTVPVGELGTFRPTLTAASLTHRDLVRTLDVTATRSLVTITHLQDDVERALEGLDLPRGYAIHHQGEISAMREAFGRLAGALVLSLLFLYGVLVPTFRSWTHPLTVMSAIPLAALGGVLALLLAYKSANMPAFMGIILLGGVAVNTSILLLDFMEQARREGMERADAVREAIRRRTRPILMTTLSTVVGMLPIALERAVGLERLSPLAIVSIGGLLVSAFLVLVYVPVVATLLEDGLALLRSLPERLKRRRTASESA